MPNFVKSLTKISLTATILFATFFAMAETVPSPEELFTRGQFLLRPRHSWDENHYGEPMDLSVRRPVMNLSNTIFNKKYGKPGTTLYANLFHRGHFYIARIPDVGVENVYFQLAYFPPKILEWYPAAHSLLRIEMNPATPIELVAEMPSESDLNSWQGLTEDEVLTHLPDPGNLTLINVAISAEASWTQMDAYKTFDLIRGKRGAFLDVVRLVSMEERFVDFYNSGNPVDQYKMDLAGKDLNRVMKVGLQMSQRDGLNKIYDTLFYNCTTMAFDIVENAFTVADDRLGYIRKLAQRRVPSIAPFKIEYYGGIEVTPIQLDPSLAVEAQAACERIGCHTKAR